MAEHSELPVKNKTQESIINFNILGCLQHTFHGMAAVCKWPYMLIYVPSYLSGVHWSLPVYVIFWCLLPYKWNDYIDMMQLFVYKILQWLLLVGGEENISWAVPVAATWMFPFSTIHLLQWLKLCS